MYEELTPRMRANYGNAVSAKDDTPPCVRRKYTLRDDPKFFEKHEYTKKDKEWFFASMADENDTCTCEPGNPGVVWSQLLSEMGPYDDDEWFVRSPQSLERDMAYFLEEAGYDAERYRRSQVLYGDI